MNSGTAKIVTEHPELGKLYRVHPWNIIHVPLGFIVPGRKQGAGTWWVDRSPNIVLLLMRESDGNLADGRR
jgi:hypothetical protein